jgi:hypothetical protein
MCGHVHSIERTLAFWALLSLASRIGSGKTQVLRRAIYLRLGNVVKTLIAVVRVSASFFDTPGKAEQNA